MLAIVKANREGGDLNHISGRTKPGLSKQAKYIMKRKLGHLPSITRERGTKPEKMLTNNKANVRDCNYSRIFEGFPHFDKEVCNTALMLKNWGHV